MWLASIFATQRSQHCVKITTLTFLAIKRLHPIRNGSWTAPCRVLHFKLAGIWQKNWRQWQNSTELFEKKLWVFCIDAGLSLFDLSLKNKLKLFDVWSRLVRLLCFSWPEKRETLKGTVVFHSERVLWNVNSFDCIQICVFFHKGQWIESIGYEIIKWCYQSCQIKRKSRMDYPHGNNSEKYEKQRVCV